MCEKRFKVSDNTNNPFLCDWSVTDYADGGIVDHPMTSENMANVMCDLLNELHDENKEFKHRIERLEDYKEASIKFTKEVEDFFERQDFDTVNFDILDTVFENFEFYSDKCNQFEKENKELKQFKKSVFALINEKITFVNECEKNHNDIGIPHEYYRGAEAILNLLKKELLE